MAQRHLDSLHTYTHSHTLTWTPTWDSIRAPTVPWSRVGERVRIGVYRMSFCARVNVRVLVLRRILQYRTSAMVRSVSCEYLQRIGCLALTVPHVYGPLQ